MPRFEQARTSFLARLLAGACGGRCAKPKDRLHRIRGLQRAEIEDWAKDPVRDLVATLRFLEPTIWHVHSTTHSAYQRHLNAHIKLQRIEQKFGAPVMIGKSCTTTITSEIASA